MDRRWIVGWLIALVLSITGSGIAGVLTLNQRLYPAPPAPASPAHVWPTAGDTFGLRERLGMGEVARDVLLPVQAPRGGPDEALTSIPRLLSREDSAPWWGMALVVIRDNDPHWDEAVKRLDDLWMVRCKSAVRWVIVRSPGDVAAGPAPRRSSDMFPILIDHTGAFAEYLGAGQAPLWCVFDGDGKLRYRGAYTEKPDETMVEYSYPNEALEAIREHRPVAHRWTPAP